MSAAGAFNGNTAVTLSSTALSAHADTTFFLTFSGDDYNFSAIVNSTPAAATVAKGPGNPGFNAANDPALGAVMGALSTKTTLGLTNGACNVNIDVNFTFLNATVDTSAANTIDPIPQTATNTGSRGTLDNMWSDNGASKASPTPADPPWDQPWGDGVLHGGADDGNRGLSAAERTNKLPAQVDRWPSFLSNIFTPDSGPNAGVTAQPLARYAGASNVSNTAILLNLVLFENNVLSNHFAGTSHPFADLGNVGYSSIAVLNNPEPSAGDEAAPGSITDFCTHKTGSPNPYTVTTIVYGEAISNNCTGGAPRATCVDTGAGDGLSKPCLITPPALPAGFTDCGNTTDNPKSGKFRYTNPGAAGTYFWVSLQQSLRDADADGKESALDTCGTTADTFDPRTPAAPGDADLDGIPDACDINGNANQDGDGDGWDNRGDNCPQAANPLNDESERTVTYTAAAPRGGPRTDGLGDPCDPNPAKADGQFITTLTVEAKCIGAVDADSDGFCAVNALNANLNDPNDTGNNNGIPNEPADTGGSITPEDYDLVYVFPIAHSGSTSNSGTPPPARQPAQVCNDGIDNDGDGAIDSADDGVGASTCRPKGLSPVDTDGDGYSDEAERHVGTDALGRCEAGGGGVPSTDWPADLVGSNDRIVLTDITSFVAPAPKKLNSRPSGGGIGTYNARWDLVPGAGGADWIVLNDLTSLVAGPTSTPPMFGGATKIFNGPICTAHPVYGD